VNLSFTKLAWDDYVYWQTANKKLSKRINQLLKETLRRPYEGIGKPEPLKESLTGYWSRRINEEHRMVYRKVDSGILVIQLRYHYEK